MRHTSARNSLVACRYTVPEETTYKSLYRFGPAASKISGARYTRQDNVPAGFSRNGNAEPRLWTSGLSHKPHPNMVLKADYRRFSVVKGQRPHEVNFGIGLAF